MNPKTVVHLEEGAEMNLETAQIGGVDDTIRETMADLKKGATLIIHDKIMTTGEQRAIAKMAVDLNEEDSSCDIISRGVAKNER